MNGTSPEPLDAGNSDTPDTDDDAAITEDEPDTDSTDGKPGREAAKYRRRLRETEAERDALRTQLTALRQGVVDDLVTEAGVDPKLLAANGYQIDHFLDEEGRIVRAAVAEAIKATAQAFHIAAPRRPAPDPAMGRAGHAEPTPAGDAVLRNAFGAQ